MASSSTGYGYFGSELPPSSADSQPRAANQLRGRHNLSSETVFRLHILGKRDWDKSQIDETRVEHLVRKAFGVTPDATIIVKSLTDHPVRQALVATLNFSRIPAKISQISPSLQEFDDTAEGLSLYLDTHFHGFTPLHSGTSPEYICSFIALSGLGGHAFGSFKRRGGDFMWLRDDLPVSVPDSRVFIYGYDTGLQASTSFQSLEDLGMAFKDALKSLLRENLKSGLMRPLILLAHSLGGLIVKEALCQMSTNPKEDDKALLKSIKAILFFGTPNNGMDIKSLVPMVEGQANESFLRSLGPDTTDLRRQAKQWSEAFNSARSGFIFHDLEIISYYETCTSKTAVKRADGKWEMSGPATKLVDRFSATNGRPWEKDDHFVQPINRDHSELVKFRSRSDPVYIDHVLPRLQSFLDGKRHMYLTDEQKFRLSSLDFPGRTSRQDQIMPAQDHTCEWLLRHQFYRAWLMGSNGLLWLEGHPGSGKSTLTNYAVEKMNKSTSRHVVFTHFFHGRGSEIQKSALGLVRSLAYQLLENFSMCWLSFWKKCEEMGRHPTWELGWLYSFLKIGLRGASAVRPIIIFIDALDECDDQERDYLGEFLTDTARGPVAATLKIFVSCRHYPNLFSEGFRIPTEINNANDIAIFVESTLRVLREEKRRLLAKTIIDNARGNFQWAQIVTQQSISLHRKGRTAADIQNTIRRLPKDIHELYDGLFKDADPEDMRLACRLFHWVCFAERPLTIHELQYIIMLSPDTKERSIRDIRRRADFREELSDMVNTITDVSRGLTEFPVSGKTTWTSKVQLIHQTVREYLLQTGLQTLEGDRHEFSRGKSNYFITRSCLRYVMMDDFGDQAKLPSIFNQGAIMATATATASNALHPYVAEFLENHLLELDAGGMDQLDFVGFIGWPYNKSSLKNLAIALRRQPFMETFFGINTHPPRALVYHDILHWASEKGIAGIVKSVVQSNFGQHQFLSHTPGYILPLNTRIWRGQNVFIDGYFNVNLQYASGSALDRAIFAGHASVVHELLQSPVINPNVQDLVGNTPLHKANSSHICQEQIVKSLLQHPKTDATLQDRLGKTALFNAVDGVDLKVLQMNIHAAKAAVNFKDIFGDTPLLRAIIQSKWNAVKLFVDSGYCTTETLQFAYEVARSWEQSRTCARQELLETCIELLGRTGLVETEQVDMVPSRHIGLRSVV